MATDYEMSQASIAFDILCETLDDMGWTYTKDPDKLTIYSGASGEDIPIDLRIEVDPDKQLVSLLSLLRFEVPESDRIELALAVCTVNHILVDGNFDYNVFDGKIIFRLTSCIKNTIVSKELFKYIILVSCKTVDDYNDSLYMLSNKQIDLSQFEKKINGEL